MIAIGLIANLLLSVGATSGVSAARDGTISEIGSVDASVAALLAYLKVLNCHSSGRESDKGPHQSNGDPCFDCRQCLSFSLAVTLLNLGSVERLAAVAPFPPRDERAARVFFVRPASRDPPPSV